MSVLVKFSTQPSMSVGRGRPDQGDAVRASKLLGQCTRYDSGERCGFRSGKAGVGGEPEPEEAT